jgi:3-oxoacyl-(acyl-carrier-protein) synthase
MNNLVVAALSKVTGQDVAAARLGVRFGRLDTLSQLALLAVESFGIHFETLSRSRIGICLAASAGSLSTDTDYWNGRNTVGGPSPTLFAYTLPSAAVGEIAIRYGLTGPNLCFVGGSSIVLTEAVDMLARGEADGCVCVACHALSPAAADLLRAAPAANACAIFLTRGHDGAYVLRENDRDMESLCDTLCAQ